MRIYQHDSPACFHIVLKGDLEDAATEQVLWAWETARSILDGKDLVVDVSAVTSAYPAGLELIRRMRDCGARIASAGPLRCGELSGLVDQPAPAQPPCGRISRALRSILRHRWTQALKPIVGSRHWQT